MLRGYSNEWLADTHLHKALQYTLQDRHIGKFCGPVFHHLYNSFPHNLECGDERETASMHTIILCSMVQEQQLVTKWMALLGVDTSSAGYADGSVGVYVCGKVGGCRNL